MGILGYWWANFALNFSLSSKRVETPKTNIACCCTNWYCTALHPHQMNKGRRQAITLTDFPVKSSLFKALQVCLFGLEFSLKISTITHRDDGQYKFLRTISRKKLVTLQSLNLHCCNFCHILNYLRKLIKGVSPLIDNTIFRVTIRPNTPKSFNQCNCLLYVTMIYLFSQA